MSFRYQNGRVFTLLRLNLYPARDLTQYCTVDSQQLTVPESKDH